MTSTEHNIHKSTGTIPNMTFKNTLFFVKNYFSSYTQITVLPGLGESIQLKENNHIIVVGGYCDGGRPLWRGGGGVASNSDLPVQPESKIVILLGDDSL